MKPVISLILTRTMAFNAVPVQTREQVYGVLGLNLTELPNLKQRLVLSYSRTYKFYKLVTKQIQIKKGA